MRAGKLDRTVTFQRKAESKNEHHSPVSAWTNIATVRAEIVTQSAAEYLTGYGEAEAGTIVFRIRFLADITTADCVLYNGVTHNLKEITEIGRRRGLELRAVATS